MYGQYLTYMYALGVTFYWLLTGKRPFTAPTDLAVMQMALAQPPRPPREADEDAEHEFEHD